MGIERTRPYLATLEFTVEPDKDNLDEWMIICEAETVPWTVSLEDREVDPPLEYTLYYSGIEDILDPENYLHNSTEHLLEIMLHNGWDFDQVIVIWYEGIHTWTPDTWLGPSEHDAWIEWQEVHRNPPRPGRFWTMHRFLEHRLEQCPNLI